MRVGASRTAPDLTITAPNRSALAQAAQPRPASPRRALPSARVSKRVPIPCKYGEPVQCSLTPPQPARRLPEGMDDEANGVDFKAFCAQFHADLPFNVTAKSPATGSR